MPTDLRALPSERLVRDQPASEQLTDEPLMRAVPGCVRNAHAVTRRLLDDLDDDQLLGPRLGTVNPPLWELGHVAWFYERWVLRHATGGTGVLDRSDALYDSMAIDHDIRWDLALPDRGAAYRYADAVRDRVLEALAASDDPGIAYHAFYAVLHEDMHAEAFAYSRQTLGWGAPRLVRDPARAPEPDPDLELGVDVEVAAGRYRIGAERAASFVFDNEKWAHEVDLDGFAIARLPVTQGEFAAFVDDAGYDDRRCWSAEGWAWRQREDAGRPIYWRRDGDRWLRRDYTSWVPIEPWRPMVHVSWYEAEAYCRWAGRRLPTEAEWEAAAAAALGAEPPREAFPWGDAPATAERANLDGTAGGPIDVRALPAGDSAAGCRQLIGNVWEWTTSVFEPYPGFVADPYADYSAPWFGDRRVLRGGSWATRGRMVRTTLRNFFTPDRRDVFAGFRTCRRR